MFFRRWPISGTIAGPRLEGCSGVRPRGRCAAYPQSPTRVRLSFSAACIVVLTVLLEFSTTLIASEKAHGQSCDERRKGERAKA